MSEDVTRPAIEEEKFSPEEQVAEQPQKPSFWKRPLVKWTAVGAAGVFMALASLGAVVSDRKLNSPIPPVSDISPKTGEKREVRTTNGAIAVTNFVLKSPIYAAEGAGAIYDAFTDDPSDWKKELLPTLKKRFNIDGHYYLDENNYIFYGLGKHDISEREDFLKMPFIKKLAGEDRPATMKDKVEAFDDWIMYQNAYRVNWPDGISLPAYTPLNELVLPEEKYIDPEFFALIDKHEKHLQGIFKDFDSFPDPAKIVLTEMSVKFGDKGFQPDKAVKLTEAANNKDWEAASKYCYRNNVYPEINNWASKTFKEAQNVKDAEEHSLPVRFAIAFLKETFSNTL